MMPHYNYEKASWVPVQAAGHANFTDCNKKNLLIATKATRKRVKYEINI